MIIEISDIFLKEDQKQNKIEIKIDKPQKIIEVLEELGIENLGYAHFYLNDVQVDKNTKINNKDKLSVLPIVGGG